MTSSNPRTLIYAIILLNLIFCLTAIVLKRAAYADTIILKDGSKEESDRVWETEHFVHFILQGTKTVEVRYAKEIVERIEYNAGQQPEIQKEAKSNSLPNIAKPLQKAPSTKEHLGNQSVQSNSEREKLGLPDDKYILQNRKVGFYDPRRPMRYWASRSSRHSSLEAALDALAKQYNRPRKWIETYMGEENDLGEIHSNLVRQRILELNSAAKDSSPIKPLSPKPQKEPEAGARVEPSPRPGFKIQTPDMPKGIKFYDPRRRHKYWTSPTAQHDNLADALKAMAEQYGTRPKWIEDHLGSTNDLSEIHNNIRKSLQGD